VIEARRSPKTIQGQCSKGAVTMRGVHAGMALMTTMAAMGMGIAWAAAPKAETAGTPVRVHRGGMTFVIKSLKVMVPDTERAPYPEQEENPGYGTLDASWPMAKSDAPEWQKWNDAVLHATQELVNSYATADRKQTTRRPDGWKPDAIADLELG